MHMHQPLGSGALVQVIDVLRAQKKAVPDTSFKIGKCTTTDRLHAQLVIGGPGLDGIVLKALRKDPMERYQSAAEMLTDLDRYARYDALDGLKNITREKACTLPRDWQEQDVEPQISRCKVWWEQVGKSRLWRFREVTTPCSP